MRNRFIVVAFGLSAFLAFASHDRVFAACFAGPDASSVFAAVDDEGAQWVRKKLPPELPSRGRLGRIDKTIISSDRSKVIRVGADPVCRSRPLTRAAPTTQDLTEGDIVAVIAWRDAGAALLRAKVYSENCAELLAGLPVSLERVSCAASGPKVVKPAETVLVELPLDARNEKGFRIERVSVVVVGRDDVAKAQSAILAVAADGETCARIAKTKSAFTTDLDGYICVDKIFRDHGYGEGCDSNQESWPVNAQDINPTKCEVVEIPDPNEFGKNCTVDESAEAPRCEGRAGTIRVESLSCGALVVPFDYASIMEDGVKPRYLRGVTSMSRQATPSSGPIVLPGGRPASSFSGRCRSSTGIVKIFGKPT